MFRRIMGYSLLVVGFLSVVFYQPVYAKALLLDVPGNENWDGNVGNPGFNSFVSSIHEYGGNIYAGGGFTSPTSHIAKWNGSSWVGVSGGVNGTIYAMASDTNYLYVGGVFTSAGDCTDGSCARVVRWNGTSWSSLGGGFSSGEVMALLTDGVGNVYAGGSIPNYLMKWNGSSWETVGDGPGGVVFALLLDSNGNLYAGGSFNTNDGGVANYLAVWDGSSWSAVDEYDAIDNAVYSLALDLDGNLVIGGAFSYPLSYLARGNESGWDSEWGGADGVVNALTMDSCGGLYVGGDFTSVDSQPAVRVAYYDIYRWNNLGNGITGGTTVSVQSLRFSHGALFAGGTFTTSGNASANNIGVWTGRDCILVNGTGTYTLYDGNLPISFNVHQQGTLSYIRAQRVNKNHPSATTALQNGAYWEIEGLAGKGNPATGFDLDLTLPTLGSSGDSNDKVCRFTDPGWDCAMDTYTSSSLTRNGITSLSVWTVGNDCGPTVVSQLGIGARQYGTELWVVLGVVSFLALMAGIVVWGRDPLRRR